MILKEISNYNFKKIEKKWQEFWENSNIFETLNDFSKPKFYSLIEFPYPSGEGLHVGHPRSYVALDVISRKRRMQGYNVLYPIGWDAFGLPAENYAIKNKIHPKIITDINIKKFKSQLKSLGISFDWNREVNTTDPKYYKWTQWIFSELFKKGLAVKRDTQVNWCLSCKCVLANEEVIEGKCERCNGNIIQKNKSQWVLRITEYAQRLIDDLDLVDYPERVKVQQKNWIGRSEGAFIKFKIVVKNNIVKDLLEVFTTRPDTVFGITYMVISPEHNILNKYSSQILNINEVNNYKKMTLKKNEFERINCTKEKSGVMVEGIEIINSFTNKNIPVFISDYVLSSYGTGAIMAVPAHDEKDWEFAKKYNIEIKEVISGGNIEEQAYTGDGKIVNSDFLNGMNISEAKDFIIKKITDLKIGGFKISYKLRDWIFSRQRYWGEPIPIIECENCGFVLDENLPVLLPDIEDFQPLENGESILSNLPWCDVSCPKCSRRAKRETDTMPQWAGSSWYFLRYVDPENDKEIASKESLDYWLPVDWYNGGMEHTTLHLLYSRFWYKFLYDIGFVPTPEPYSKRTSHGVILGENNEKMSKSRGNVVNPDEIINEYGADTMRLYEMFIGDFESVTPWNSYSVKGCYRFIEKLWSVQEILVEDQKIREEFLNSFNETIKKVSNDIEKLKFNTAISSLMTLLNLLRETKKITIKEFDIFTLLLSPFAPHVCEEMRSNLKLKMLNELEWPSFKDGCIDSEFVKIVIQVNGKFKDIITVSSSLEENKIIDLAIEKISKKVDLSSVKNKIYVPKKLLNFVI